MLNKDGQRMLCYPVVIDDITPITGSDNCECAVIGGWKVMTRKEQFQKGEKVIYFEVDSLVPADNEAFAFMSKYKYKVKTQRYTFGGKGLFFSQGLILPFADLGLKEEDYEIHTDLTKKLGVKYYEPEDNKRKANIDPYRSMIDRHKKLFRKPWVKKVTKYTIGRKIMFALFGRKKDNKKSFPSHFPYIKKSDEERCENIPFILEDKDVWVKTTKIDGTSSLFLLERKKRNKFEFWVCSRNVRQLDKEQACYHQDNVYWEVEEKYNIQACLEDLLKKHPEWTYVAIQGESAGRSSSGAKIQGDPNKFGELRFFAYNFITSDIGRWGSLEGRDLLKTYNIPWVPIVDENYILPDDFEEFKQSADGPCEAEGASGAREGYVYRRKKFINDGINSFKNVSREFLIHKK